MRALGLEHRRWPSRDSLCFVCRLPCPSVQPSPRSHRWCVGIHIQGRHASLESDALCTHSPKFLATLRQCQTRRHTDLCATVETSAADIHTLSPGCLVGPRDLQNGHPGPASLWQMAPRHNAGTFRCHFLPEKLVSDGVWRQQSPAVPQGSGTGQHLCSGPGRLLSGQLPPTCRLGFIRRNHRVWVFLSMRFRQGQGSPSPDQETTASGQQAEPTPSYQRAARCGARETLVARHAGPHVVWCH